MSDKNKADSDQDCPNYQQNVRDCTCGSVDCPRRGICCECIAYHRSNGGAPSCLR